MRAKDAMTTDVLTVSPNATAAEAALLMRKSGHGALPVVDSDGRLVGLLKKATIVRRLLPQYLEKVGDLFRSGDFKPFQDKVEEVGLLPVSDLVDPHPLTASEDTPLAEVASQMIMHQARQALILRQGRLIGIVGMQDIIDRIAWKEPQKSRDL